MVACSNIETYGLPSSDRNFIASNPYPTLQEVNSSVVFLSKETELGTFVTPRLSSRQ
jgi:hypothetical protein